jgi:hypothetical protein
MMGVKIGEGMLNLGDQVMVIVQREAEGGAPAG